MTLPDPFAAIRMTALGAMRGANYWSRRPVTRMDLAVGPYDDISSAEASGFTEQLVAALPGLVEHRCSIGERGGFVTRLQRGTYAPHIVEHVALELQTMIGHHVGYGRTRGGDLPGEYTLVFEHRHEGVGLRAAALALGVVQRAFAGTLHSVAAAVAELELIAQTPAAPPAAARVLCGVTGGGPRAATVAELTRRLAEQGGAPDPGPVVDVSPGGVLQAGLPYARSECAIVLDADLTDVPERYQDPERARRLASVVADAVERDGVVVAPAKEWEIQDYARDAHCRVAVFSTGDDVTARDKKVAWAAAWVDGGRGRIVLEQLNERTDGGVLRPDAPVAAQVAAALGAFVLAGVRGPTSDVAGPSTPDTRYPTPDSHA